MERSKNPAAEFARDGVAALGALVAGERLIALQSAFEEAIGEGFAGPYATIVHDAWRKSPVVAELARELGSIACRELGIPELVLFHDHFLHKNPGGEDMDWHQDFSYLPLDRPDGLTLFVAVSDVTEENGCLYYLRGTHTSGELRASWGIYDAADPRALLPPILVDPEIAGEPAEARAGEVVAHHAYLLHRSPRNRTATPRRTWLLSFVGPEARWSPRHAPHPRSSLDLRVEGQELESDLIRVHA